jgi:hypothetical protein
MQLQADTLCAVEAIPPASLRHPDPRPADCAIDLLY